MLRQEMESYTIIIGACSQRKKTTYKVKIPDGKFSRLNHFISTFLFDLTQKTYIVCQP